MNNTFTLIQTSSANNDQVRREYQSNDKKEFSMKGKTLLKDATAGACAGAVAKTAVAPIERVKILMQLQNSIKASSSCKHADQYKNASAISITMKVYREQGVLAFWRGNTANVMRQAGNAALNFMLMDWYKAAVTPVHNLTLSLPSNKTEEQRRKRLAVMSSFLSGGLAGGTATTFLYPFEFLRTRLAMDIGNGATRQYPNGMRDVFCSTLKLDGVRGLYQGYGIAVGGVIIYRALHLGGYDAVKTELAHRNYGTLSMTQRFVIAQIVSLIAGTICYPIDSVRRRLMMQAGVKPESRNYKNSLDCFVNVYRVEGIRGFYLGIAPNLLRSVGGALLLVAYDTFKGII